jgi:hypothetical protein
MGERCCAEYWVFEKGRIVLPMTLKRRANKGACLINVRIGLS